VKDTNTPLQYINNENFVSGRPRALLSLLAERPVQALEPRRLGFALSSPSLSAGLRKDDFPRLRWCRNSGQHPAIATPFNLKGCHQGTEMGRQVVAARAPNVPKRNAD
jgi:hypothetical protein